MSTPAERIIAYSDILPKFFKTEEKSADPDASAKKLIEYLEFWGLKIDFIGVPTQVPNEASSRVPQQVPNEASSRVPPQVPPRVPPQVPNEASSRVPPQVPPRVPQQAPPRVPQQVPNEVQPCVLPGVPSQVELPQHRRSFHKRRSDHQRRSHYQNHPAIFPGEHVFDSILTGLITDLLGPIPPPPNRNHKRKGKRN